MYDSLFVKSKSLFLIELSVPLTDIFVNIEEHIKTIKIKKSVGLIKNLLGSKKIALP